MTSESGKRADKVLWALRIFKTRSLATEACKKGRILIEDIPVKPSRILKEGDILLVKKPPVNYSYRITDIPKNRLSAKLVSSCMEDITSPEELAKLEMADSFFIKRDRGSGRPTKKDRGIMDKLRDS